MHMIHLMHMIPIFKVVYVVSRQLASLLGLILCPPPDDHVLAAISDMHLRILEGISDMYLRSGTWIGPKWLAENTYGTYDTYNQNLETRT